MDRRWLIFGVLLAVTIAYFYVIDPPPAVEKIADVDGARIVQADSEPGNWLTHGRTYSEQRFSPLDQINSNNVDRLGLAWYFDLETLRGVEGTPVVVDGVMYTTSAWSVVYALDARTGRLLWSWDPQVDRAWAKYACCDVVNRGVAVWKSKIYVATLDGRLAALDAATGSVIWDVLTIDRNWPYTITGAPRVVNGKVIIGNAGAEYGVRGYVSAYDAESGELIWRFFTVPGNPADGFESAAMEMAAATWNGSWWEYGGGGTAWDAFAYDPELNYLYIGTGNGSPWPRDLRSPGGGDNLFLSSIVAVNADTGGYVWHYQTTPGENWDYTAAQQIILADLDMGGRVRKVLMQAPKNGFFYVIDRATGKLLSANNFVPTTWATHIDLETGRPVEDKSKLYGEQPIVVHPSPTGGHSWHPMAFSPVTELVYIPAAEGGFPYTRASVYEHRPMAMNQGWNFEGMQVSGEDGEDFMAEGGALIAWDPLTQSERWRVSYSSSGNGGVLATAGNLLAQGVADGRFAIYRADNGELLWDMPVQTGPIAGPIAYEVDGEQYIAVSAGWGGIQSMFGSKVDLDHPMADARILAFKLGANVELPPPPERVPVPKPPVMKTSGAQIGKGAVLYHTVCFSCHGAGGVSGGSVRDLRFMSEATHEIFSDIVLRGAYQSLGMPSFADQFSEEDVEAIHAFITAVSFGAWMEQQSTSNQQ